MNYPSATINAEDFKNHPPLPEGYQPKEIEIYYGENAPDSVYHWKDGKWIRVNYDNMESEDVIQILVDDQWVFIQAGGQVLLDRVGEIELPPIPNKQEMTTLIAESLSMEEALDD
ncbi:hypothetical protein [aff. Roholtiella sp. LEGE 12411]|uniref:hypothetical protein n=1 Tax=aff. Roholtiella sp. LEGE 12411 TaxID=1828822 RepID=UPI0018813F4F|nr:hypothetical protein [aff. Roholtiella sp. LEGE 12411]MBE9035194.1 hypothetical protein [aff. Roholtiella sp. LEGE 12411]